MLLTDVEGVLDSNKKLISEISVDTATKMIEDRPIKNSVWSRIVEKPAGIVTLHEKDLLNSLEFNIYVSETDVKDQICMLMT